MFTTSQIGAVALFLLTSSEDVLGRPLLYTRQTLPPSDSSLGNFGKCTVPEITFAVGFDNRRETSFEPTNLADYNHGSADGIDIITNFMCDQLVNGADATAQATCAAASAAADTQLPGTGFQADAFNAVMGISTNFGAIDVVTDQGTTLGVDGTNTAGAAVTSAIVVATFAASEVSAASATDAASSAAVTIAATSAAATDAASCPPATVTVTISGAANDVSTAAATSTAAASTTSNTASATTDDVSAVSSDSASQIGNFGSCTIPQIEFGVGFDGRTETAFQPTNQADYNHGSADNIGVITQFMCNNLVNTCGADATAKATCATATTAAAAALAPTGQQADAFNAVFGIKTNFAAVDVISNTGVNLGVDGTSSA